MASRVRVAALRIDLPVVAPPPPPNDYPLCDVAMYIEQLGQPGEGRATYLYAHAREGMFLPILTASLTQNGKRMLGMIVEVYTNDDKLFLYEITEVRRHQLDLEDAAAADTEQVWLQTSEGPEGHARQDPGHRHVPVRGGTPNHSEAAPEAAPVGLRLTPQIQSIRRRTRRGRPRRSERRRCR